MSKFIEVPTQKGNVLLGLRHIFKVEEYSSVETRICISVNGFNSYPFQYVDAKLSYSEVLDLIQNAQ